MKIDKSGTIQWQKSLGSFGDEEALDIEQTSDGGYIMAGYCHGDGGNVSGSHGSTDCWVVKLNAAGNVQWQKCLGGSDREGANSIKQTYDGGYVMAGYSVSNDGDVSGNHGGLGGPGLDYWIVKLSSTGSIQWQKCLGGSGTEEAKSILQTTDGGYLTVGQTNSNDGDVTGYHNSNFAYAEDCWIVKLDSTGNMQWQKCMGGNEIDQANNIQLTMDGGYIMAGQTVSNDGDVSGNHGSSDYWIVKLRSCLS